MTDMSAYDGMVPSGMAFVCDLGHLLMVKYSGAERRASVLRHRLLGLVNGRAGISGEMALRIEKAFDVKMDTLMRMQSA
jgi:plasmid maintenance system antidote protein VapI